MPTKMIRTSDLSQLYRITQGSSCRVNLNLEEPLILHCWGQYSVGPNVVFKHIMIEPLT